MKSNIFIEKMRKLWLVVSIGISLSIFLLEGLYRGKIDMISVFISLTIMVLFMILRVKFNKLLEFEGMYDALTSIGNKKKFIYDLNKFLKSSTQFSICYIDVDDFKGINDRNGHNAGDEYLVKLVECLQELETKEISVYRIGGDEFVYLILNSCDENKFIKDINKIKEKEITFKNGQKEKLAFSVGIARSSDKLTLNKVIDIADKIMYDNKYKSHNL